MNKLIGFLLLSLFSFAASAQSVAIPATDSRGNSVSIMLNDVRLVQKGAGDAAVIIHASTKTTTYLSTTFSTFLGLTCGNVQAVTVYAQVGGSLVLQEIGINREHILDIRPATDGTAVIRMLPTSPYLSTTFSTATAYSTIYGLFDDCPSGGGGGGGSGTVTSFGIATANGFAGSVANPTTTPVLTIAPNFTGIAYSNGTGLAPAIAANFPTLNQNTTGTASAITGVNPIANGGTGATTAAQARANLGAAASGMNTDIVSVALDNNGLKVKDTDASHTLSVIPGSNLSANRTLTLTTGDANRTLTLTGDASLAGTNTGDQPFTITGDVTAPSSTSTLNATIGPNKVLGSMIADMGAAVGGKPWYDGTDWQAAPNMMATLYFSATATQSVDVPVNYVFTGSSSATLSLNFTPSGGTSSVSPERWVHNIGSANLVLNTTAAWLFDTRAAAGASTVTLLPGRSCKLVYQNSSSRFKVVEITDGADSGAVLEYSSTILTPNGGDARLKVRVSGGSSGDVALSSSSNGVYVVTVPSGVKLLSAQIDGDADTDGKTKDGSSNVVVTFTGAGSNDGVLPSVQRINRNVPAESSSPFTQVGASGGSPYTIDIDNTPATRFIGGITGDISVQVSAWGGVPAWSLKFVF